MGLFDIFKKKTPTPAPEAPKNTAVNSSPAGFYELCIAEVVRETADAISIYFEIPPHLQSAFSYKPGQYITLRIHIDNQPHLRCYSLSSCPYSDSYFRIAIKTKKGGVVSGHLVNTAQKGAMLDVFTPLGNFTPNLSANTNTYILYAGGSGITPMLSIAKALLKQTTAQIHLLYANRNSESTIYAQELAQLSAENATRFHLQHVWEQATPNNHTLKGILTAQDYANWVRQIAHYAQAEHYICGPEGMMQSVKEGLVTIAQIAAEKVHLESFDFSAQNHERSTTTHSVSDSNDLSNDNLGTNATITLQRKQHYIHIAPHTTVLTACLDNGIDAPFMCEAGVCSSCRAKLTEGKVNMQVCYALSDKEIAEGYILTCQAIAQSNDVTVNFDA